MFVLTVQIDVGSKRMMRSGSTVGHHAAGPWCAWRSRDRVSEVLFEPFEAYSHCIKHLPSEPESFWSYRNQLMFAAITWQIGQKEFARVVLKKQLMYRHGICN